MVTVAWLNFWSCCFSSGFKCSSERSFYLMWLFSAVFSTTDLRCLKASETTERLRDEQIIKLPWDSHAFLLYVWCVTAAIGLIAQKRGRFGLRSLSFHFLFWHANPQGRSKSSSDLGSRVCTQQSSLSINYHNPAQFMYLADIQYFVSASRVHHLLCDPAARVFPRLMQKGKP